MLNPKILTEIGEYFGRFKNDRGHLEFFQDRMSRIQNGKIVRVTAKDFSDLLKDWDNPKNNHHNQPQPKADPFLSSILSTNFSESGSRKFYEWQKKVIARLQSKSNDVYVVAPPGGGKTTPLMAHYMVDLYMGGKNGDMASLNAAAIFNDGANMSDGEKQQLIERWANIFHSLLVNKRLNKEPVPKCLFITPIRVLAFEQAEGFQEYFLDLLLLLKSLFIKLTSRNNNEDFLNYVRRLLRSPKVIDQILGKVLNQLDESWLNRLSQSPEGYSSFAKGLTEKMIFVKTGGGSGEFNGGPDSATVIIATYGSAKNFISNIANTVKFIVFDEAHLYMPSEYGGERAQDGEVRAAADAYIIVDGMSRVKDAQIAFLSGTIHPISAQNFCEFVNKRYGRNLETISTVQGDTQSGNKTELNVIPDDAIRSEKVQVERIVRWVNNNEKGNAIILFSKRKINHLVDEAMKRLAPKDIRKGVESDKPNSYREEKIKRFRDALAYTNPNATGEQIKRDVDAFIAKEFPTTRREEISRIKNKPGAMNITNKKLRTAVSYGIGYIYRQDQTDPSDDGPEPDNSGPISEEDKMIVARLFSEGKINVLVATAAIGVGVNVSIRNMYIPSCEKFEKDKYGQGRNTINNKREMSQLINRTGRGVTKVSGIYTPSEFVNYLREVVMMGPEDFNVVPAISIYPTDNLKSVLLRLATAAGVNKSSALHPLQNARIQIGTAFRNFKDSVVNKIGRILNQQKQQQYEIEQQAKRAEEEAQQIQNELDATNKYNEIHNDIDGIVNTLKKYEEQMKRVQERFAKVEEIIVNYNRQNSNIPLAMPEDKYKQYLNIRLKLYNNLTQIQSNEAIAVVKLRDKLKQKIDEFEKIPSTQSDMKEKYLQQINTAVAELDFWKKNYPELLSDRTKTMNELNRMIADRQEELQKMRKLFDQIRNSSTSQNVVDDFQQYISNYERTIKDLIQRMKTIQYYN